MHVVHEPSPLPVEARGAVLALGMFDGVHLGHRAVIDCTLASAERRHVWSAVLTFDRHPASVVAPDAGVRLLTDLRQRTERIAELGTDLLYVAHFDEDRSLQPPSEFLTDLVRGFEPSAVVVGDDVGFGHRRRGDLALLHATGERVGFDVEAVATVSIEGVGRVSSTAVRDALREGDVELARRLLGRSHSVRGVVEHGDQRGGTVLGFPTANVAVAGDIMLPGDGVYGGAFRRADGTRHRAAISVGRRPTFYDENGLLLVEAYLLDFDGDLYGEHVEVVFDDWVRGQVRFDSVDALIAQMRDDVEVVRKGAA